MCQYTNTNVNLQFLNLNLCSCKWYILAFEGGKAYNLLFSDLPSLLIYWICCYYPISFFPLTLLIPSLICRLSDLPQNWFSVPSVPFYSWFRYLKLYLCSSLTTFEYLILNFKKLILPQFSWKLYWHWKNYSCNSDNQPPRSLFSIKFHLICPISHYCYFCHTALTYLVINISSQTLLLGIVLSFSNPYD